MAKRRIDLTGQVFGKLTVVKEVEQASNYIRRYLCECECGASSIVTQGHLRMGHTISCGCVRQQNLNEGNCRRVHGDAGTLLYRVWSGMKSRCYTPTNPNYPNYGAKGVQVIAEWLDYEVFKQWAILTGYNQGLTIERVNVYKDYCPENCKWIPLSNQGINKRKYITNTSGYVGVGYSKSKQAWIAKVTINGKRKELGKFLTAYDAHVARGEYFKQENLDEHLRAYNLQIQFETATT